MELNDTIRTTFAARDYTGEELPDEILYDILETARFAPSGGNRQGNRVIIVRDQATKDCISDLNIPAAKRYVAQVKAGENPWNVVVPMKVSDAEIEATEPASLLTEPFKTASVVLVFLVDLKVVASVDQYLDRIGIISGASIYPFVWNVLLLARQAGYGGGTKTPAGGPGTPEGGTLPPPCQFWGLAVLTPSLLHHFQPPSTKGNTHSLFFL